MTSKRKKIIIVLGTRSEVIKFSSLIREISKRDVFDLKVLHTGQHDTIELMEKLNLGKPDIFLGLSPRAKWSKAGKIKSNLLILLWLFKLFIKMKKTFIKERPDAVFYQGNCMTVPFSVFAAKSIILFKKIKLIHRESGMKIKGEEFSGGISIWAGDKFGDILFTQSSEATEKLKNAYARKKVFDVGDPHVEIINYIVKNIKPSQVIKPKKKYIVVSIIKHGNADDLDRMKKLLEILNNSPFYIVYPMLEYAKQNLKRMGLWEDFKKNKKIIIKPPFDYVDFLNLIKGSEAVFTDSAGIQQEAAIFNKPCVFMSKWKNVWEIFEKYGLVKSFDFDVAKSLNFLNEVKKSKKKRKKYPLGDGKATERIVNILEEEL